MRKLLTKSMFSLAVLFLGSIYLLPYVWTFLTSIKPPDQIYAIPPVIIPRVFYYLNYFKVLWESSFILNLKNSLIVSTATMLVCLLVAVPASYAFARLQFLGKTAIFISILAFTIFPGVVILAPLFIMLSDYGLLDTHLALILPYTAYFLPLIIWILSSYFKSIPPEMEDAARVDGCNTFQVIRKIILPLCLPGVFTTAIIAFILAWNEFLLALVFTQTDASRTAPVAISMFRGTYVIQWGQMTAAAVTATLPIVAVAIVAQKGIIQGLTAGGVKG